MAESAALLNIYDVETEKGPARSSASSTPCSPGPRGSTTRSVVGDYVDRRGRRVRPRRLPGQPGVRRGPDRLHERGDRRDPRRSPARPGRSGATGSTSSTPATGPTPRPSRRPANVLGAFAVDDAGQVVPGSFQYNANHRMFDREFGTRALLFDRAFYDWLHATSGSADERTLREPADEPAHAPGGLEVVAADQAVEVEHLAREVEARLTRLSSVVGSTSSSETPPEVTSALANPSVPATGEAEPLQDADQPPPLVARKLGAGPRRRGSTASASRASASRRGIASGSKRGDRTACPTARPTGATGRATRRGRRAGSRAPGRAGPGRRGGPRRG